MDKKVYKDTTFTRNTKNFKENIWKAKKYGFQFYIFRKDFKWRIEAKNTKINQKLNIVDLGFDELEHAFEYVVKYKESSPNQITV